jgi:hypothetical protein
MTVHQYIVRSLLLLSLLWQPVFAAEPVLDNADRQAIHDIIQSQLDAFLADDAAAAFAFASPNIQAQFGSPETFMSMVKTGYQAVYRPRAIFFKEILMLKEQIIQQVLVVDQNEQSMLAFYPMQRQQDGSWRIDGCVLQPAKGQLQLL